MMPTESHGSGRTGAQNLGSVEGDEGAASTVRIELVVDFIYRNSLLGVHARAAQPFRLRCLTGSRGGPRDQPALIVRVEKGSEADCVLVGNSSDGDSEVEATLATGFYEAWVAGDPNEPSVDPGGAERVPAAIRPDVRRRRSQRAGTQYGMRFYPFVSSTLEVTLDTEPTKMAALIVRMSTGVRPVKYAELLVDDRVVAPVDTTSGDEVVLIYEIPESMQSPKVDLALPVRAGGPRLAQAYNYPLLYWGVGLVGVALTARLKPDFTEAAVAALAIFLLQQWRRHERPQRISLLHGIYAFGTLVAIGWATIWANGNPILCGIASLVLLMLWVSGIRVILRFERRGDLPKLLAGTWSRTARLLERRAS
jgi:hypothetical protein